MRRFDLDQSPESRAYLEQFAGTPRYFSQTAPVRSAEEALERCSRMTSRWSSRFRRISAGICAGAPDRRSWRRWTAPRPSAARPSRSTFKASRTPCCAIPRADCKPARRNTPPTSKIATCTIPTFESIYSIVPSVPALLLILIPAILMTVSIVREKELGSMINFYVTPTGRLEYLLGKQLPYIAIGMLNFFILVVMALIVFGVPIKGSFLMLTLCTLLYVTATTGIGMVTSTFTSSQVAAVFVTAILTIVPTIQFSGLLQPVSTLEGSARFVGSIWPTTYYMHSSVGAYTKGLGPDLMMQDVIFLACCIPILWAVSIARLEEAGEVADDVAAEHLLAWDQGASQPVKRSGDDAVRRLRVHLDDLHPGDRHLERGQQRLDRLCGRGRFGLVQGTVQRLLSAALSVARDDRRRGGRRRDGPGPVHVRRRDPAAVRSRPSRRSPSGHPGEHRRDRHAAGRHRRGLHQEHHQRRASPTFSSARTSTPPDPSIWSFASCSTRTAMSSWFTSVVAIINQITLLTVVLTGAAVIREREHGTLEHLLVMPLTAFEIAMAKVWANSLVILVATALSLFLVVQMALQVPFAGSVTLWFSGVVLYLFFATALGIIPGDDFAIDGAVRAFDHPGGPRAAASFGRIDARREPAEMAAVHDVLPAVAALRQLLAGDHLSRRRH